MKVQLVEKPTVYLETSIISYLAARPSRDIRTRRHQMLTRRWWGKERHQYSVFISPIVFDEASKGDPDRAAARVRILGELQSLEPSAEIDVLGEGVRKGRRMPIEARLDALHLAYAIQYEMDYLATWNCAHLANAQSMRLLADFTQAQGLWLPIICTPEEMISEKEVE
jgi:predicted nucleic acid-binding protein